jgi:hypothetical protein
VLAKRPVLWLGAGRQEGPRKKEGKKEREKEQAKQKGMKNGGLNDLLFLAYPQRAGPIPYALDVF